MAYCGADSLTKVDRAWQARSYIFNKSVRRYAQAYRLDRFSALHFFCTSLYCQENNVRTLIRAAVASLIAMVVFVGPVSAATNSDLMVAQATASGTITGTVKSDSGSGVASATVVLDGPQRQTTTTDGSGAFSATVAPGVYAVTVTKAGYQAGSSQVTVAPSTTVSLNVALTTATLSNLNVIGRTSSNNS